MGFNSELDLPDFEDDESMHGSGMRILIGVHYRYNFLLDKR